MSTQRPLREAAVARRLRHLARTVECGLHSGIPACCVRFYVTRWLWYFDRRGWRGTFPARYRARIMAARKGFEYVPCPACLRRGRARPLLRCPTPGCWHAEEQAD